VNNIKSEAVKNDYQNAANEVLDFKNKEHIVDSVRRIKRKKSKYVIPEDFEKSSLTIEGDFYKSMGFDNKETFLEHIALEGEDKRIYAIMGFPGKQAFLNSMYNKNNDDPYFVALGFRDKSDLMDNIKLTKETKEYFDTKFDWKKEREEFMAQLEAQYEQFIKDSEGT